MWYKDDLKIEFRAVFYTGNYHVIEYRISPDQNLKFKRKFKLFWLIPVYIPWKFNTKWHQPYRFRCGMCSEQYPEHDDYHFSPILISEKSQLEKFKNTYKTIGEFYKYLNEKEEAEYAKYREVRAKYLDKMGIWK